LLQLTVQNGDDIDTLYMSMSMSGCGLFFLQGRGDLHFLTEATKLIPESPDRDRYRHKIDNFPRLLLMKEHAVFTQTS
jgi:hypothetical protein